MEQPTVSNSDLTIGNLVGSETLTLTGAGTVVQKMLDQINQ